MSISLLNTSLFLANRQLNSEMVDMDTQGKYVSEVYKKFSANIDALYDHVSFINRLANPKHSLQKDIRKKV